MWVERIDTKLGQVARQIVSGIEAALSGGELSPGDRLPTVRALASRLGVAPGTVMRAYRSAADRGLTQQIVGSGTFIAPRDRHQLHSDAAIDFSSYQPPSIDLRAERGFIKSVLYRLDRYAPGAGWNSAREAAAKWGAAIGIGCGAEDVVVTSGAHSALALVLNSLRGGNVTILSEALSYAGLHSLAKVLGLPCAVVPCDTNGPLPEALRHWKGRSAILYLVPDGHNPTAAIMPQSRREELARAALESGVKILEDHVFRQPSGDYASTFAELAPSHTYSVASLSKWVAPGLRFGFVLGPPERRAELSEHARALHLMPPTPSMNIASEMVLSGRAAAIARQNLATLNERIAMARSIFADLDHACSGGHVWLPIRGDTDLIKERLSRQSINVTADGDYRLVDDQPSERGLRICLGAPASNLQVQAGLQRLRETVLSTLQADASPHHRLYAFP